MLAGDPKVLAGAAGLAKDPNPPVVVEAGAAPNGVGAGARAAVPKAADPPLSVFVCPNGDAAPPPSALAWPNDVADEVADADATGGRPNMEGSREYFFAKLRNNSSSFPAYLVSTLSTS